MATAREEIAMTAVRKGAAMMAERDRDDSRKGEG